VIGVYDLSCMRDLGLDGKQALSIEEVRIELEQVDSSDPPLAVHVDAPKIRLNLRDHTPQVGDD
jgi:hypothetical protein